MKDILFAHISHLAISACFLSANSEAAVITHSSSSAAVESWSVVIPAELGDREIFDEQDFRTQILMATTEHIFGEQRASATITSTSTVTENSISLEVSDSYRNLAISALGSGLSSISARLQVSFSVEATGFATLSLSSLFAAEATAGDSTISGHLQIKESDTILAELHLNENSPEVISGETLTSGLILQPGRYYTFYARFDSTGAAHEPEIPALISGSISPAMASISVEAIPEPSTTVMIIGAAIVSVGVRKRRIQVK